MKFSIIIPVYNVEKYIIKCLESINTQTYDNYEVIIVNDGSPDNSEELIKKYIKNKKKFIYYKKENGGLSDARNYGVKHVSGDYILFVDSDDYIDKDLLLNLNNVLKKKKYDLIKFNFIDVIDGKEYPHYEPLKEDKEVQMKDILYFDYFEPACSYCYNTKFYKKEQFEFELNRYHEDLGLLPLIVLKANSMYYLNYFCYYYVKRENSIMLDKSKEQKKADDVLYFCLNAINYLEKDSSINKKQRNLIMNFYSNAVLGKLKQLVNKKDYLKKVKSHKIYKYLPSNNVKQLIKKMVCRFNYLLYIKLFK